ncbi:MAG TPA: hypothetical protein PLK37_13310 [Terricaulis sp.]|nr:hypothetical protein [Terricaulis sp.]
MKKRHAIARAVAAAMIASTLLAGLAISSAAAAGGSAKAKGSAAKGQGESPELSSRSMDAPYLAVPIVRQGVLANYLFVSVRVEIASGVDLWRTREQAHILRDALVRASHGRDLADPNDPNALNQPLAIEVYRAAAIAALGERAVAGVSIIAVYSSQGTGI